VQVLKYASPEGNVLERKDLYQNDILQKAINAIWFANQKDEGVVFNKFFEPIPLPTIALVLTAVSTFLFLSCQWIIPSCQQIECGIDEWKTGSREDVDFKLSDYKNIYQDHIGMLNILKDETQNIGIVPNIQSKLYKTGRYNYFSFLSVMFNDTLISLFCRFYSGMQPLAAEQGSKLTAAAIQNAIQDWDDKMESDFSDGHDIEGDD
jgi:hypothetical protein